MKYQTNSYSEFKEVYNFISNIRKLLLTVFPTISFEDQKMDKEGLMEQYMNKHISVGVKSDTLADKLSQEIKDTYRFNDFSRTYLPLKAESITNKTSFNSLLLEGMRDKTQGFSEDKKLHAWAEIIAYLNYCLIRDEGVKLYFEGDLNRDTPIIKKLQSVLNLKSGDFELQVERGDYAQLRQENDNKYKKNFDWFIDPSLFRNHWDDKDFCLNKIKEKFGDIVFVDKKLFENTDFIKGVMDIIVERFPRRSYNSLSYYNEDSAAAFMENKEEFVQYLDAVVQQLPQDYVKINNLEDIITIYKYQLKNKSVSHPKLFSAIERIFNDDIENINYSEIRHMHKNIEFIRPENISNDKILNAICSSFNYHERESSAGMNTFLQAIDDKGANVINKDLMLKIFTIAKFKYFHIYGDVRKKVVQTLQDINSHEYISILKSTPAALELIKPQFKLTDNVLEEILAVSPRHYLSLLNKDYINRNYKKVLAVTNYDSNLLNEIDFKKNVSPTDKDFLVEVIQHLQHLPEFIRNLSLPQFYKNDKLDIEVIKYLKLDFLHYSLGEKRGKLCSFFKNITEKEKDILLLHNIQAYRYLPESKRVNKMDAVNFLNGFEEDKYQTGLSSIPSSLFVEPDFCLHMVKAFLHKQPDNSNFIEKIPELFWFNKEFILNVMQELDKSPKNSVNKLVSLLPVNVGEFFTKFEIKTGEYHDFMSAYIAKQELKNLLTEPAEKKRVNKL